MLVDEETARDLRAGDSRLVRVFAASCAERMAAVFCALRAVDSDRSGDIAYLVETLEDLWNLDLAPDSYVDRAAYLQSMPELRPNDLGFSDVVDLYGFYGCLAVLYATRCAAGNGDPDAAISAGHALLVAMHQFDSNSPGSAEAARERARHRAVLSAVVAGRPPDEVRQDDRAVGRELAVAIENRLRTA